MRHPMLPIGFFILLLPCLSFAATNNKTTSPAVVTQNSASIPSTEDTLNMTKPKTTNNTDNDIPDMPDPTKDNTNVLDGD